jgi:hypothetical protein
MYRKVLHCTTPAVSACFQEFYASEYALDLHSSPRSEGISARLNYIADRNTAASSTTDPLGKIKMIYHSGHFANQEFEKPIFNIFSLVVLPRTNF